jgi:hypothetical protein
MENTHIHLTITFGEVVDNLSNTMMLFSSTLIGTGNELGETSFNNITIRSISFRGQRFSNNSVFRARRCNNG